MLYSEYTLLTLGSAPDREDITSEEVRNETGRAAPEPHGWVDVGYIPQRNGVVDPAKCFAGYGPYALVDDDGVLWAERPAVYLSDVECAERTREQYRKEIRAQTNTTVTVAELVNDPEIEADVIRQQSAGHAKLMELEATADEDLPNFDPTIEVYEPQAKGVGYAQLSLQIAKVEPWVGAPDDDMGWVLVMRVPADQIDEASEARVSITSSPDGPDGPLPPVQDTTDPRRWVFTAREGHKWQGDTGPVTAELRRGSGGLVVGRPLTSTSLHDRDTGAFRYGVPTGDRPLRRER